MNWSQLITSRHYSSPLRAEQTRQTRSRIVTAARALFVEAGGYTATTMAEIARAAGVSTQTLYNAYGSKAALLKQVYDIGVVGDDESVPLSDRPEIRDLARLVDPREFLAGYARLGRSLLDRLGPFVAMVVEGAAAGDSDLKELLATTAAERRIGAGRVIDRVVALGALRPGLPRDEAIDLIWTLNSFQIWDLLVQQRGWTPEVYAEYVGRAMADAVLA